MTLARTLDPDCQVAARRPRGAAYAFDVCLTGRDFDLRCAQRMVRALKIEDTEQGESYDVIATIRTASSDVRTRVLSLLRSKYPEVADTTDPAEAPAAAAGRGTAAGPELGCVAALVGLVGLSLVIGFRDTIWNEFFRSGFFAATYMVGVSAVLAILMWWGRRKAESAWIRGVWVLGLVILVVGTVGALGVWREDVRRFEKVSRALDLHTVALIAACVVVNLPGLARWLRGSVSVAKKRPGDHPPVDSGPPRTGIGWLLVIGVLAGPALVFWVQPSFWEGYFRPGYYAPVSMLVSSGLLVAVLWWCRGRLEPGPYRTSLGVGMVAVVMGTLASLLASWADGGHLDKLSRASTWHNLGIMVAALIVTLIPVARWVAGGRAPRLTRAAIGMAFLVAWTGVGIAYWAVATGKLKWEPPDVADESGYLRVVKEDRDAEVIVERPGERLVQSEPGGQSEHGVRVQPDAAYTLSIRKGATEVHNGVVRLRAGERREIRIPPIAVPERNVPLVPKGGSFPRDVMRMEFSPDQSAVAVERFDGPILVFDAASGKERFTIDRPRTHCTAFGFSPDGKRLAYLAPDGPGHVLRVVDVADGHRVEKDLKPRPGRAFFNSHALAYSMDGNRLAVSVAYNAKPDNHWESQILRWELAPGGDGPRELDPLGQQEGTIEALRFTPNGSQVLAVAGTHTWTAWDWETGKPSRRNEAEVDFIYDRIAAGGPVEAVAGWGELSHKVNVLFSQRWPEEVVFMSGENAGSLRFASLTVSSDGKIAAAGVQGAVAAGWDQQPAVRVWNTGNQKMRAILLGHTDWPMDITFDRTGTGLVTAGKDGTVRTWRLP
jgi:hypothetical protein